MAGRDEHVAAREEGGAHGNVLPYFSKSVRRSRVVARPSDPALWGCY